MSEDPFFTKKNQLYLVASTGDRKFLEIGAYADPSKELGLYQKLTVTGERAVTHTMDFGDGSFTFESYYENKNTFSGLYIEGDLEVSNRAFISNVNIGVNDLSSHPFASHVGQDNSSQYFDPLLQIKTYNLGYSNITNGAINSFNIGGGNSIEASGAFNFNLGFNNTISTSGNNSKIFGKNNSTLSTNNTTLVGDSNTLSNNLNSIIVGHQNSLASGYNNTLFGTLNSTKDVNYTSVFGERNDLSGVIQSDIYGDDHIVNSSQDFILLGEGSVVSGVNGIINIGEDNTLNSMFDGITIGNNNSMSNQLNTYSFGSNNSQIFSLNSVLIGRANTAISETGSTIIGSVNTIDSIIDTEVHGSRNTLRSLNDSFIVGSDNSLISGDRSFIFGGNISATNTVNSMIIGLDYDLTGQNENIIDISNSFNSSIKIKQDRIDIKSPGNSLYYNGSSILTMDTLPDLQETGYTKIRDKDLFDTNIITDYDYKKLSKKIELQPFKYVNTETRISNVTLSARELDPTTLVEGKSVYNSKQLVSGGYFVQRTGLSFDGIDFVSNNCALQILFTGQFASGWGIKTKDTNQFLFGTRFGTEYQFPVSGWGPIGNENLSGLMVENIGMLDTIRIYAGTTTGYSSIYTVQTDNSWNHSSDPDIKISYNGSAYFPYILQSGTNLHYRSIDLKSWKVYPGYNTTNSGVFGVYNTFKLQPIRDSYTGHLLAQSLSLNDSFTDSLVHFNSVASYQDKNSLFAVIYGKPAVSPLGNLNWLIVDKYSSGIYYTNKSYDASITPQTGWTLTGYGGYSGRNSAFPEQYIKNIGTKIVTAGNSSGVIGLDHPSLGRVYVPCFL